MGLHSLMLKLLVFALSRHCDSRLQGTETHRHACLHVGPTNLEPSDHGNLLQGNLQLDQHLLSEHTSHTPAYLRDCWKFWT